MKVVCSIVSVYRFTKWNFPHCIGAVDGKHITLQKPKNAGSIFFNYKQRESIVLMAVCDADYKFTVVDIGQPGGRSDGGIWDTMEFAMGLENGEHQFILIDIF